MIFLSAQPGINYFLWQLDLLIFNLNELRVKKENIHILLSYGDKTNQQELTQMRLFKKRNASFASIFFYKDTRESRCYPSSIRPHIISKHLKKFPKLNDCCFFYHDSDILFRCLPDFKFLEKSSTWFVADTKSYLGYSYLKNVLHPKEIEKMCHIVGIDVLTIKEKDECVGGAQYVMKSTNSAFWYQIELQCELMYKYLLGIQTSLKFNSLNSRNIYKRKKQPIQAWCADMWVILWNAWLRKIDVKVHADLNFCWPINNIKDWHAKKILHYAGNIDVDEKKYFRKMNFIESKPYFDIGINEVSELTCSFPIIETIQKFKREVIDFSRENLMNITFLLVIDNENNVKKVKSLLSWIDKFFETQICVIEVSKAPSWPCNLVHQRHQYLYIECEGDKIKDVFQSFQINDLKDKINTEKVVLFKYPLILAKSLLMKYINKLDNKEVACIFPIFKIIQVDSIFTTIFSKCMSSKEFTLNVKECFVV